MRRTGWSGSEWVGSARASVEVAGGDEACMELEDIRTLGVLPDDLVKMDDINEATILYNLRRRFLRDKSYTNLGTILIAVNPFRKLGIYDETQAWLQRYEHPSATHWTVTGRSSPTSFH